MTILKEKTTPAKTNHQKGADFEQLACQFLTAQDLTIITTNYRLPKVGEIDIIALHQTAQKNAKPRQTLVFVEVKARTDGQFAKAHETITPAKQQKIIKTAEHFLQQYKNYANLDCRFDVIAYQIDKRGNTVAEWLQGAFWVE